jgi:hypothetical protein
MARLLAGHPPAEALTELSPRTGHICRQSSCRIHQFFDVYAHHLEARGVDHSPTTYRRWLAEDYCPDPYNADLELLDPPPESVETGERLILRIRAINRGQDGWLLSAGRRGVRLGARILGPYEQPPDDPLPVFRRADGPARDIARAGLVEGVVPPGEQRLFKLELQAPSTPGSYVIHIDMVDEQVHWFSDLGWPGILLALKVAPAE